MTDSQIRRAIARHCLHPRCWECRYANVPYCHEAYEKDLKDGKLSLNDSLRVVPKTKTREKKMKFEEVLPMLRSGKPVRRESWMHEPMLHADNKFLYVDSKDGDLNKMTVFPNLIVHAKGSNLTLNGEDLLADDWEEVE